MKLIQAAEACRVSRSALHRIVCIKQLVQTTKLSFFFERKHDFKQLFDDAEEKLLAEYLVKACQMCS